MTVEREIRITNIFARAALCKISYGKILLVISKTFLNFKVSEMDYASLCNLPLFGACDLDVSVNKVITQETIRFIENTK